MSDLICLHCEQPLALFQRLSGESEFCSKEHRRLYHKERERLALQRLLEAAPKRPVRPGAKAEAPSPKPTVVEEPLEMEEPTVISLGSIAARVNRKAEPAVKAATKRPEAVKKPEPAKKAAPDPAGFARSNGVEPRSKAAVPRSDALAEAIEWKPAPAQRTKRKPDSPAGAVFLSPGSFLPFPTRFAALATSEAEAGTRVDPVAFPPRAAELQVLRERLRRADRVGFGPS